MFVTLIFKGLLLINFLIIIVIGIILIICFVVGDHASHKKDNYPSYDEVPDIVLHSEMVKEHINAQVKEQVDVKMKSLKDSVQEQINKLLQSQQKSADTNKETKEQPINSQSTSQPPKQQVDMPEPEKKVMYATAVLDPNSMCFNNVVDQPIDTAVYELFNFNDSTCEFKVFENQCSMILQTLRYLDSACEVTIQRTPYQILRTIKNGKAIQCTDGRWKVIQRAEVIIE